MRSAPHQLDHHHPARLVSAVLIAGLLAPAAPAAPASTPATDAQIVQQASPYLLELSLVDPVRLGALSVTIDYFAAPGSFRGEGIDVGAGGTLECSSPMDGAQGAFFDCEDPAGCPPLLDRQLGVAIIKSDGFMGPTPVAECIFDSNGQVPVVPDFDVRVIEAADETAAVLDIPPAVVISAISAISATCDEVAAADCNGNGILDAADPVCTIRCLIGLTPETGTCECGADCNCNGELDAGDTICSIRTLIGTIQARSCTDGLPGLLRR